MSTEQFERFYVLEQFREFFASVLRFKQELEASVAKKGDGADEGENLDDLLGAGALDGGEPIDPAQLQVQRAEFVHSELVAVMQRQSQDILRRGDEREQRRFREVQYVMAAMADEVLLDLTWPGKDYFSNNLIEEEIFRTHDAGTRFFTNLEEILRLRDPTRAEVAAAYLLALSLGFRGRYRDVENQPRLENYRQQLFASLFQRNPGLADDVQLYGQAYAHTLAGKDVQWLPLLRPWLIGMAVVGMGYVILAHIVWAHASGSVAGIVERLGGRERQKAPVVAPSPRATAPAPAVGPPAPATMAQAAPESEPPALGTDPADDRAGSAGAGKRRGKRHGRMRR